MSKELNKLFEVNESCSVCEKNILFTFKDINADCYIKCPNCGSDEKPCSGCSAVNRGLGCKLKCDADCIERVAALRGYMLAKSEELSGKNHGDTEYDYDSQPFQTDEECSECNKIIKYNFTDIRPDGTITCPHCKTEKQMPCAGCMIIDGRLGYRLECKHENCTERLASLRGYLLGRTETISGAKEKKQ